MTTQTSLEWNIQNVSVARARLLESVGATHILFAKLLWRTAEISLMEYQLRSGCIRWTEAEEGKTVLAISARAMQQTYERIRADVDVPKDDTDRDESVAYDAGKQLTRLTGFLNSIFAGDCAALINKTFSVDTVAEWYSKLTFIAATMVGSVIVHRVLKLGFTQGGDEGEKLAKDTQLIGSLSIRLDPSRHEEVLVYKEVEKAIEKREDMKKKKKGKGKKLRQKPKETELAESIPVPPRPPMSYADVVKAGVAIV